LRQILLGAPTRQLLWCPVDISEMGNVRVMCGIGTDSIITNFCLEHIKDDEIRQSITKVMASTR